MGGSEDPSVRRRIKQEIGQGSALLTPGRTRPNGWSLSIAGTCQSYVDLDDPTFMRYPSLRIPAVLAEAVLGSTQNPTVVHIGGGALAIPRRLSVTVPGSRHHVVDPDEELMAFILDALPLRQDAIIMVHTIDAMTHLSHVAAKTVDAVILDAYVGNNMPEQLTSSLFVAEVGRVLRPDGALIVNILDVSGVPRSREYAQRTVANIGPSAIAATPGMFAGTTVHGNCFVVSSPTPLDLERIGSALDETSGYRILPFGKTD